MADYLESNVNNSKKNKRTKKLGKDDIAELAEIKAKMTGKKVVFRRASNGIEITEVYHPNGDMSIITRELKQEAIEK